MLFNVRKLINIYIYIYIVCKHLILFFIACGIFILIKNKLTKIASSNSMMIVFIRNNYLFVLNYFFFTILCKQRSQYVSIIFICLKI